MNTVAASDIELLVQYRAGSETAFSTLVSRHVDWVYSAALRRVGDRQLAEDVTQAVFLALARNGPLREGTVMSAWLFQVLRFTSTKAIRSESRRREHEAEAARRRLGEMTTDDATWHELAPLLDEAVSSLGARDRAAVLLRFYQRQSLAEIARDLAISEEGARKRISRAIAKLRSHFARRGWTVPATALAATMETHTTHAAPVDMAIHPTQSTAGQTLFHSWLRHLRLQLLFNLCAAAGLAMLAIGGATLAVWMTIPAAEPSALAMPTSQAATNAGPSTRPSDITMPQIIAGLRRQETAFQNIYIKDFDTTVDRLPRGQTQWTSTHWRYRGSAWYDGDPRGKVRIYFTDLIEPWQMDDRSPVSWIEIMRDMSWDGVEGRELRVADSSMRGGMMRTRIASIQDQPPMMFDRFTRWATGVGFSLQYLVTQNDDTYPPRPHVKLSQIFQSALPYANRGGWTISRETVNGFDAVRVRFGGVKGSSITYWFDPSRGFAIVKYQEVLDFRALRPDGGGYVRTQGFDVQQLQELRPGVWFPMQATEITEAGEGSYQRYNFQAADAVADDPKLDPKIFTAPIPTGWMVTETRGGLTRSYVTMDGGAEQEIHEGEPMPRVKAGIAENPDGNTPAVATQGRAVW